MNRSIPTPPRSLSCRRRGRLLAALACAVVVTGSLAHEWNSPSPHHESARRPAVPQPGASPWSGQRWAGPEAGRPDAPSASHCRRAPQAQDWPEPGTSPGRVARADHRALLAREAESLAGRALDAAPPPAAVHKQVTPLPRPEPGIGPWPAPRRPADEPVTAGVVDDNADFGRYLAYRQQREQFGVLGPRFPVLDISARHRLVVHDAAGRPVPDAVVSATLHHLPVPLWARTDAAGRAWLHPGSAGAAGEPLVVQVQAPTPRGLAQGSALLRPGQRDALQITLDRVVPVAPTRLDLVFLVDATGSMGDEIDKLKRSLRSIAAQIARLPQAPDVCWGLVAYRDRGDAFFVRTWDFTDRLDAFQAVLDRVQAAAGGDMPEALNEGLHAAVHGMSWRGDGATRLVLLVADAPPHPSREGDVRLDHDTVAALAQGIKLMALGASGLDERGEFAFRQMAQFTGGRFVFLTYAQADDPSSGPGRETRHDVEGYSVESLDRLIVRLVREELEARGPLGGRPRP